MPRSTLFHIAKLYAENPNTHGESIAHIPRARIVHSCHFILFPSFYYRVFKKHKPRIHFESEVVIFFFFFSTFEMSGRALGDSLGKEVYPFLTDLVRMEAP